MAEQTNLEVVLSLKDELSGKLAIAKKGLDGLGSVGSAMGTALKNTGMIVSGAMAGAGYAISSFTEKAGKFESVKDAFNGMGESLGVTSESIITSVKNATRNSISEFDILSGAVRAGSLIGKEAMGDFGVNFERMSVVAKKASRATGQDVSFMFDSIITGVGRNSPMILDNLGITMKISEAYEKWGEKIGKNADDLDSVEQKTAILNYALEQAEEKYADVAVSAGGYSGALQTFGATMGDLKIKIGTVFLPIFNEIIRAIQPAIQAMLDFFVNNKDQIISSIATIAEKIKTIASVIWENIKPAVDVVIGFFEETENRKPLLIATLTVLGLAITAFAISVISSMLPIIATVVAIEAIVFLLAKAWNENWGGIQDKTKAVMQAIVGFYNEYIVPYWKKYKENLDKALAIWKENWDAIKTIFQGIWQAIYGVFQVAWALLSGAMKIGIDIFTGNWKKAWEDVKTIFSNVFKGIYNIGAGIFKAIIGSLASMVNSAIDLLNKLIDKANDIPGIDIGKIGKVKPSDLMSYIPTLAVGTNYVPKDTLAYIHEGEAVVPKKYNPSAGGVGGGVVINIGDIIVQNEADEDRLIEKMRLELSRDQEKANWGIA